MARGRSTSPRLVRVSARTPTGSASAESDIRKLARDRYKGGRTFYVRGHLLNQQLHGPGAEPGNLAPISQDDNQAHEREIEHAVKQRVLDQRRTVRYAVTLDYSPHSRNLEALRRELRSSDIASEDRDRVRSILEAEQKLPSGLTGRAAELAETPDHQLVELGPPFVQTTLPLRIAEDLTGFDGARRRQGVVLTGATRTQIATIPDLTSAEVDSIVGALQGLRRGRVELTRYDQLQAATPGVSDRALEILRNDRWTRLQ